MADAKRIIDLTHEIYTGMPIYQGDKPYPTIKTYTNGTEENQKITLSEIHIGTHAGTHIDAPKHFIPSGKLLSDYSLKLFLGKAICIRRKLDDSYPIDLNENDISLIDKNNPDWIVFRTNFYRFWKTKRYFTKHPFLSEKCSIIISGLNITGIGIDFPSVDSPNDSAFTSHHILLGAEKLIVENLTNLKMPPSKAFQIIIFPIKIKAEASPVRVAAIIN
jgi:kynurenine formamidase